MAVDFSTFVLKFPEFSKAPTPATIEEAIATEDRAVADSWPAGNRDDYVALRAADLLAQGPVGRNARLVDDKSGVTIYADRLRRLERIHAMARSRTGTSSG